MRADRAGTHGPRVLALAWALASVAAAAQGDVGVDAPPPDRPLAGALALRLAAEGYCVVSAAAHAATTVHLERREGSAAIDVRGLATVHTAVALSGTPVDALEVQHRALIALEEAGVITGQRGAWTGVRVELVEVEGGSPPLRAERVGAELLDAGV